MAKTAQAIIKKAIGEIGVKENPSGSNKVKYNTEYYGSAVSGNSYPWCCVFVWWVFKQCGMLDLFCGGQKTAYCPFVESYYKNAGRWYISNPKVGDLVLFDFSNKCVSEHIGILEAINSDGTYTVIEGNTSVTSNDNGGAVMRRTRNKSVIRGFARPSYETSSASFVELTSVNDVVWELAHRGFITDKNYWLGKLSEDKNVLIMCQNILNIIRKSEV